MINPRKYLRFPNFKSKAVTLSYDDGQIYDRKVIEILREYDMKGTFNLCSNSVKSTDEKSIHENELKSLYLDNGMEIAIHGENHGFWTKQSELDAISDVINDRVYFEKVLGVIIRGMAYPNGMASCNEVIAEDMKKCGLAYGRITTNANRFDMPTNWLMLNTTNHHDNPDMMDRAEWFNKLNPDKDYNHYPQMFYLWGHSYEFNRNDNWEVLENFCKKMCKQDNVWYATNIEICEYVNAFNQLVWSAENQYVYNPTNVDIYLNIGGNPTIIKAGSFQEVHG